MSFQTPSASHILAQMNNFDPNTLLSAFQALQLRLPAYLKNPHLLTAEQVNQFLLAVARVVRVFCVHFSGSKVLELQNLCALVVQQMLQSRDLATMITKESLTNLLESLLPYYNMKFMTNPESMSGKILSLTPKGAIETLLAAIADGHLDRTILFEVHLRLLSINLNKSTKTASESTPFYRRPCSSSLSASIKGIKSYKKKFEPNQDFLTINRSFKTILDRLDREMEANFVVDLKPEFLLYEIDLLNWSTTAYGNMDQTFLDQLDHLLKLLIDYAKQQGKSIFDYFFLIQKGEDSVFYKYISELINKQDKENSNISNSLAKWNVDDLESEHHSMLMFDFNDFLGSRQELDKLIFEINLMVPE